MDLRARCDELKAEKGRMPERDRFRGLLDVFWEFEMTEHPEWATYTGYPGQNDRWSDSSPAAIERRKAMIGVRLDAIRDVDASQLEEQDALSYDLILRRTELDLEYARFPDELLALDPHSGPHSGAANLLSMMPLFTDDDVDNALSRIERLPVLVDQTIELLREGLARGVTQPRVVLENVPDQIRAFVVDDGRHSPLFAPLESAPAAAARLDDAAGLLAGPVARACERLLAFVEGEYVPGARETIAASDLPDGEAWYALSVRRFTTTSMTPKEIHDVGLGEVARIRAEMDAVIAQVGFEGDFRGFLEFLRTDDRFFFETAEDLLREYRDISKRADPELIKLFGTLPRQPYGVIPVPPHSEKTATTAYYVPGSNEVARPGYFYANTYDLRARPKWEMEALTLHEAVPGHHLQIALAQELGELPAFRRWDGFTAFVEGWGLYAESLGEEMGFYQDPYSRFGQLTYEMWRAIRLVVDTGMHALGWTRDEAIDLFLANTGKTDHDIAVEVDRYIGWPGQALAYKIGELTMKRLRAEATEALGARFDVRAFHDALLGNGAVPLDVLEERIHAWVDERART